DRRGEAHQQAGHRAGVEHPPVGDLGVDQHRGQQHEGCQRRHQRLIPLPQAGESARAGAARLRQGRDGRRVLGEGAGTGHRATALTAAEPEARSGVGEPSPPRTRRRKARERIRSDCSRTSTMMTIALKAGVAAAGTPRNRTVLFRVAISSAPTVEPRIENFPPARDVPPITTARIASSSMRLPVPDTLTVMTSETVNRPPHEASTAARTYTAMRMGRGRMPAIRLALGLMPIDSIMSPSAVRRMTRAMSTTIAIASTKLVGRPRIWPFASWRK